MLSKYLQDTTRLLRDFNQRDFNPRDLTSYINTARREVAGRSQCIRVLTPVCGAVQTISVTNGGSGYSSNPTVTISAPDFPSAAPPYPTGSQATASAIVQGGVITAINVDYGGSGYFQPSVTITDDTGTGAEAEADVPGLNLLNIGQEIYQFSDIDISTFPGVESVIAVRGISVIYSNWRYSLVYRSFSTFQAQIRSYTQSYQYIPSIFTQFGQGTDGSLLFYPQPSQQLQCEMDCMCLPSDLVDDQSYEAIPNMWRDGIKYYAASLAMFSAQNYNSAAAMEAEFDKYISRYANYAQLPRRTNPYGRGRW